MSSQTVSVVDIFKSQLHNLQAHTSYILASVWSDTCTYKYACGVRSVMQIHISSGRSNNIVAVLLCLCRGYETSDYQHKAWKIFQNVGPQIVSAGISSNIQ